MPRPKGDLPFFSVRVVALIIDERPAAAGKLDTDLMGTTGAKFDHDQRLSVSCAQDAVGKKRLLSVCGIGDGYAVGARILHQIVIQRVFFFVRYTFDDGHVGFDHLVGADRFRKT